MNLHIINARFFKLDGAGAKAQRRIQVFSASRRPSGESPPPKIPYGA